jgi:hypothetical protein
VVRMSRHVGLGDRDRDGTPSRALPRPAGPRATAWCGRARRQIGARGMFLSPGRWRVPARHERAMSRAGEQASAKANTGIVCLDGQLAHRGAAMPTPPDF